MQKEPHGALTSFEGPFGASTEHVPLVSLKFTVLESDYLSFAIKKSGNLINQEKREYSTLNLLQ